MFSLNFRPFLDGLTTLFLLTLLNRLKSATPSPINRSVLAYTTVGRIENELKALQAEDGALLKVEISKADVQGAK